MKVRALLLFLVCLILGSCGKTTVDGLDFAKLSTENGYSYPELTWGMSIEEAEDVLGTQLQNAMWQTEPAADEPVFAEQESILLFAENEEQKYLQLCGGSGMLSYQFHFGKLICVSVIFKEQYGELPENDLDKLWTELLAYAEKTLGEKTSEENREISFGLNKSQYMRFCEWRKDDPSGSATFVRLTAMSPKIETTPQSITLDISSFTPAAT